MIEIYNKPGLNLKATELETLHQEILGLAMECLDGIPDYQCLSGKKSEYDRLIIAVSRNEEGSMDGFCSSYILDAEDEGNILHLGLTCVSPRARGLGLTHKLTSKVITTYLLRYSLLKPAWVSNVACVLSSLGNVAMHFEDVYPSPFMEKPSKQHIKLAKLIDQNFRHELYINHDAVFSPETFVFEKSVTGTMFEKSEEDRKFYHRDSQLNNFYKEMIDFQNGDEVLQIGKVSLLSYPKYVFKNWKRKNLAKLREEAFYPNIENTGF
jgi:hypothetical protein